MAFGGGDCQPGFAGVKARPLHGLADSAARDLRRTATSTRLPNNPQRERRPEADQGAEGAAVVIRTSPLPKYRNTRAPRVSRPLLVAIGGWSDDTARIVLLNPLPPLLGTVSVMRDDIPRSRTHEVGERATSADSLPNRISQSGRGAWTDCVHASPSAETTQHQRD